MYATTPPFHPVPDTFSAHRWRGTLPHTVVALAPPLTSKLSRHLTFRQASSTSTKCTFYAAHSLPAHLCPSLIHRFAPRAFAPVCSCLLPFTCPWFLRFRMTDCSPICDRLVSHIRCCPHTCRSRRVTTTWWHHTTHHYLHACTPHPHLHAATCSPHLHTLAASSLDRPHLCHAILPQAFSFSVVLALPTASHFLAMPVLCPAHTPSHPLTHHHACELCLM